MKSLEHHDETRVHNAMTGGAHGVIVNMWVPSGSLWSPLGCVHKEGVR